MSSPESFFRDDFGHLLEEALKARVAEARPSGWGRFRLRAALRALSTPAPVLSTLDSSRFSSLAGLNYATLDGYVWRGLF
jgi:hypothetical protein